MLCTLDAAISVIMRVTIIAVLMVTAVMVVLVLVIVIKVMTVLMIGVTSLLDMVEAAAVPIVMVMVTVTMPLLARSNLHMFGSRVWQILQVWMKTLRPSGLCVEHAFIILGTPTPWLLSQENLSKEYGGVYVDYAFGKHRNAEPANLGRNFCIPPTGGKKVRLKLSLLAKHGPNT